MPIVVTTAPTPPPVVVTHVPLTHVWRGPDGSVLNLTDLSGNIVKVRGATGFGAPPVQHWWSDSPAMSGSLWNGYREERTELFVPIEVWGADSADFLARHRTFEQSISAPGDLGSYWVYTPDGAGRYALCRYADGLDAPVDLDPVASCRTRYGITLARDDPYWHTGRVSYAFSGSSLPVNTTATKLVTNSGDVPAWPRWTTLGVFSTFTFGAGSGSAAAVVRLAPQRTITSTSRLIVETDPRTTTISVKDQAGVDRWSDVSSWKFAPIDPGQSAEITIGATGSNSSTSLTLEFTPAYRTAW